MANTEKYGSNYYAHLLEEYKLYVQMSDNIGNRRAQNNVFFISILSALQLIPTLLSQSITSTAIHGVAYIGTSVLGLVLCYLWAANIQSYKQLSSAKFKVIHEIEKQLPFACYDREWEFLGQGRDAKRYFQITRIEYYIPLLLSIPFLFVFIFMLYKLLTM